MIYLNNSKHQIGRIPYGKKTYITTVTFDQQVLTPKLYQRWQRSQQVKATHSTTREGKNATT